MSLTNKQVVEKVNEAFDRADIETFLSLCAESVVWTMLGDVTWSGKDAIREAMKDMNGTAPDFTNKEIIAEDNAVVSYGTMNMPGKDGTNEVFSFCDIYHFKDDVIQDLTTYMVKHKQKEDKSS